MSRGRAPPFKQRIAATLAAAKAAGADRVKITTPDGSTFEVELQPAAQAAELNDFDTIPPQPLPTRKHLKQ